MDTDAVLERRRLRRRASFWRVIAFLVVIAAVLGYLGLTQSGGLGSIEGGGRPQVAEIAVSGFIATKPEAVDLIEKATKSSAVKAIILHIDSPGGAASGGEALYHAVRDASAKKPVVAEIEGLGASAAYLTAIASDHIVARESAITGSIGVIFEYPHIEDLLGKVGVKFEEVKSAPLKGEPSLFTPTSPEARDMIQGVVNDSFDWFVGLVAERRGLSADDARRLSDGSIYTGRQALKVKLIDAVGGDAEARAWLATEKGVSADLPAREWKKDKSVFSWFGSDSLATLGKLLGLDPAVAPILAALLQPQLPVDGLLAVWHASGPVRSDR